MLRHHEVNPQLAFIVPDVLLTIWSNTQQIPYVTWIRLFTICSKDKNLIKSPFHLSTYQLTSEALKNCKFSVSSFPHTYSISVWTHCTPYGVKFCSKWNLQLVYSRWNCRRVLKRFLFNSIHFPPFLQIFYYLFSEKQKESYWYDNHEFDMIPSATFNFFFYFSIHFLCEYYITLGYNGIVDSLLKQEFRWKTVSRIRIPENGINFSLGNKSFYNIIVR